MDATLKDVAKKTRREPTAEEKIAEDLVRRAREQGLSLTGPDGLLKQLTKTVLETTLDQELTEHLGHEKNGPVDNETGNARNGTQSKTVLRGPAARWASRFPGTGRDVPAADRKEAAAAIGRGR
jgi:transposase-like protein